MKHYHGTPIGGPRTDVARFLRGRLALVPFPRPDDIAIAAEVCSSFIFDSGAFTIWRQGGELDVAGYIAWCAAWARHPGFDWALIPDVVDGSVAENDALLGAWPSDIAGVPVYHLHEPLERAHRLASNYQRDALGSSGQWPTPGTASWWSRMGEVMAVMCDADGRPRCKLHGLRMLDPGIFAFLPLASADSTNAAVNGGSLSRFGMYLPPTAAQRCEVIAERIEAVNSAPVWTRPPQMQLLA